MYLFEKTLKIEKCKLENNPHNCLKITKIIYGHSIIILGKFLIIALIILFQLIKIVYKVGFLMTYKSKKKFP